MKSSKKRYAAIDLHSNNLFIAVVDSEGRRLAHARLFCELHEVDKFLRRGEARIAAIAVESTFNWYWLVDGLRALGYSVVLANPAGIVQYDGLKHADDRSDAFFLAELLRLGILPTGYILEPKLRAVRDLLRRRASLVSKRTSLILSLRNMRMRIQGTSLGSNAIKAMPASELVALFGDPAEKLVADVQKGHIDALGRSIRRIERHVTETALSMPNYTRLTSVPGIGRILAMTIVLEVGDIGRFATAGDFASYARTVKADRSSNGKSKGANNRKCGNRHLAWAFVEAANFIRRYDERAERWHARKKRATNAVVATKALACKLAKTVWHILSEGTEYDGDRLFGPAPTANATAA